MTLFQQLSGKIFFLILFILNLVPAQQRDWAILDQLDTLYLFAQNQCAGIVISSTKADYIHKRISTYLNYSIDPAISGMELIERRKYDFKGNLLNVKQTLRSASGTTRWSLDKTDSQQWSCKTTTGGKSEIVIVEGIKDNIISEYNITRLIKNNSMKKGTSFIDTIFDVMTRENYVLKTTCTKIPDKKNIYYEFEINDNKMNSSERWVVDSLGRTIEQDVPPMFVAKREKCNSADSDLEITDLWDMLKIDVPPCFNEVKVNFTPPTSLHPTVFFLYDNLSSGNAVLNEFDTAGVYSITPMKLNTERWLENSLTIQKDSNKIKKIAAKNSGNVRERMLIIKNLTFFVYKYLDKKAIGTFSNALETLEAGYGDCGEHAVLLAALLRAVNIPANVVLGLVTLPGKEGYFYHAWVVVPFKDGVVFADASQGNVPATSGYIPLIIDSDGRGAADLVKYVGKITINCKN